MRELTEILNYFRDTSKTITDSYNMGTMSDEEAVTNYILLGCIILGIDTDIPVEMQQNSLQEKIDKAVLSDMTPAKAA